MIEIGHAPLNFKPQFKTQFGRNKYNLAERYFISRENPRDSVERKRIWEAFLNNCIYLLYLMRLIDLMKHINVSGRTLTLLKQVHFQIEKSQRGIGRLQGIVKTRMVWSRSIFTPSLEAWVSIGNFVDGNNVNWATFQAVSNLTGYGSRWNL